MRVRNPVVAHQNSHSRPKPRRGEDGEKHDHAEQAALLGLGIKPGPGPAELAGQHRDRRRQLAQERAHGVEPAGHHPMDGRSFTRRGARLRCPGRRALGLGLQPRLDGRVPQQLSQCAQLLGAGLDRLGDCGSSDQQRCEGDEEKQQSTHVGHPLATR